YCLALLFMSPTRGPGLNGLQTDDPALRRSKTLLALTVVFFVLLDVVIDPVALRGDRWFLGKIYYYPEPGVHFGIPIANYIGWGVVGFVAVGLYRFVEGRLPAEPQADGSPALLIGCALYYAVLVFNLAVTWFASAAMHFPRVFQVMFVLYVILGTVVFLLLDAPPVPKIGGWKAGAMLVLFYALISGVFVVGASLLPQYDPTVEKGKIDKIVKPKMETPESRHAKLEEL